MAYLIQFIYLILKNLYQLMVWISCAPLLIFMERSRHCPLKVTLEFQSHMLILTKQKQNGKSFVGFFFTQHRSESGLQKIVTTFLASSALVAGFPNLASLARLAVVLPVTTATVERSFSDMKLIKTRLRSRLGEETLNHTMRISIEGPDKLNSEDLDSIIQYWKEKKTRKLMI